MPRYCYNCKERAFVGNGVCLSATCQANARREWEKVLANRKKGGNTQPGKKKKKKTGKSKQKADARAP